MISVHHLSECDLNGLKTLYDNGFKGMNSDPEKMIANYNLIKNNENYIILCAKYNDKIVGSIIGIINIDFKGECKPFMVIENVIVDENYRRQGIANNLMNTLENIAMDRNCSYMILVSGTHRIAAHKFYESIGFNGDNVSGFKKFFD